MWEYEAGRLVRIEHPELGALRVETQGAWVMRIERDSADEGRAGRAAPLLQARYSDAGHLLALPIGAGRVQSFTWYAGQLVAWESESGECVRWHYETQLLSEIAEASGRQRRIRWGANKAVDGWDSRWRAPLHLAAVRGDGESEEESRYALTWRGFVLEREWGFVPYRGKRTPARLFRRSLCEDKEIERSKTKRSLIAEAGPEVAEAFVDAASTVG